MAAGFVVAMKRGNERGAKGPAAHNSFDKMEGKGEMIKAPIALQDLRRKIYVQAKAEPSWRFWGMYDLDKLIRRDASQLGKLVKMRV